MMKRLSALFLASIMALSFVLVFSGPAPASAAPYDPSELKVSVDPTFWQNYHLPAAGISTEDIVTIYRIKKADVTLYVGDKAWQTYTFTPQESKERTFVVPHGLTNLRLKLKAYTADETTWTYVIDVKSLSWNHATITSSSGTLEVRDPIIR